MDDSFKKLNGPSADQFQSDYIEKEKRAAEELLKLQLGNAKTLYDLQSKLLGQLESDAKEQGKGVIEYLAGYNLERSLAALATLFKAKQESNNKLFEELSTLQAIYTRDAINSENRLSQIRRNNAEQYHRDNLARIDALKQESLKAQQQINDLAKNATRQAIDIELVPELDLSTIDAKANVSLTPELSETDLALPETTIKVIPEIDKIEPIDQEAKLRLTPEITDTELDQHNQLLLTPEVVGDVSEQKADLALNPTINPIVIPEAEVVVHPEVDINLPDGALDKEALVHLTFEGEPDLSGLTAPVNLESDFLNTTPFTEERLKNLDLILDKEIEIATFRLDMEGEINKERLSAYELLLQNAETLASVSRTDSTAAREIVDSSETPATSAPAEGSGTGGGTGGGSGRGGGPSEPSDESYFSDDSSDEIDNDGSKKGQATIEALRKTLKEKAKLEESVEATAAKRRLNTTTQLLNNVLELEKDTLAIKGELSKSQEQIDQDAHDREMLRHAESENTLVRIQQEASHYTIDAIKDEAQLKQEALDDAAINQATHERDLNKLKHDYLVASLKDEAQLRAEALNDEELRHQKSINARQQKEQDYQKLKSTGYDVALLLQQMADQQADEALDAQIKKEQTRQDLFKSSLQRDLSKTFKKEDAKYASDPTLLDQEIDAGLQAKLAPEELAKMNEDIATKHESLNTEQEAAEQKAIAEAKKQAAPGEEIDESAIKQRIQFEYDLKRKAAADATKAEFAGQDKSILKLLDKKKKHNKILEDASKDAAKKAEKLEDLQHKKRLGQKADLMKDYGVAGAFAGGMGTIFGAKDAEIEAMAAKDPEEANRMAQEKLDAAFDALGNFVNQLADKGKESTSKQSAVDTRLQGLSTNTKEGGMKKVLGSYWRSISTQIATGISVSPFFKQETAEASVEKLVGQGIAFNLKERAFLDTLKDKIATTFNVADGTLLKLVRIQQSDTTAARLGMESALTEFLNSMYATTEYMQQAAESIRSNLYEATALMGAKEATEFEYQVQKWMGSLYSVGFSNAENLSATLGKLAAGDVGGITEGSMGNLLVMAANEASLPIATILEKGLTADDTDKLMSAMVQYLAKIYDETKDSRVLAQQFGSVYGLTAADLKAAANLAPSIEAITKKDETYGSMLKQVQDMTKTMALRTSTGEMFENLKANFTYSMATTLANNPVLSGLNNMANMLNDLVGGIEIPFINVYGFGFDLNATVADLMNVAALSGSVLGGMGKMIAGLGNALNPASMLKTFGVEEGLDVLTRGSGAGDLTVANGATQSESGYVGNESSEDVQSKTVSDASSGPEKQVAEAKQEQEDKEEARSQMVAGHIVDIYELLQDVVAGAKKFHVQLDVGNNPISWAAGTWN